MWCGPSPSHIRESAPSSSHTLECRWNDDPASAIDHFAMKVTADLLLAPAELALGELNGYPSVCLAASRPPPRGRRSWLLWGWNPWLRDRSSPSVRHLSTRGTPAGRRQPSGLRRAVPSLPRRVLRAEAGLRGELTGPVQARKFRTRSTVQLARSTRTSTTAAGRRIPHCSVSDPHTVRQRSPRWPSASSPRDARRIA